ncbi:ABC transporter ATP-binding protein [Candidatus Parcubacteria bacterium]|nr:ABC transporter ATP-binding protein [Candidatus Parcubacteria bacterium]
MTTRLATDRVVFENISKSYRVNNAGLKVVDDISLTVDPGKFVCLIGPNGSGKTTLLKILAGIEKQSAGKVTAPDNIAYLPQQGSLMPWLTVRENLRLPAKIKNQLDNKLEKNIDRNLKQFGLDKFAGFYPAELSGGMQQKVALIRTALYTPDLIILDEPFSALDAITRLQMQVWLVELWRKLKCTVICVTHDINESMFLADEIYVLSSRPGKIIRQMTVDARRPRDIDKLSTKRLLNAQKELRELLVNERI